MTTNIGDVLKELVKTLEIFNTSIRLLEEKVQMNEDKIRTITKDLHDRIFKLEAQMRTLKCHQKKD